VFDPEKNPKEALTILIAAGLLIFKTHNSAQEAFKVAEQFVAETERHVGRLNP
jgi:hypothetical protein